MLSDHFSFFSLAIIISTKYFLAHFISNFKRLKVYIFNNTYLFITNESFFDSYVYINKH